MLPDEAFSRVPNPGYADGRIYLYTHIESGKKYIGQTVEWFKRREQNHLADAVKHRIKNELSFQAAIRKFGIKSFSRVEIDQGIAKINLGTKERYWISEMNTLVPNGYNILRGGESGGSNPNPRIYKGILFKSTGKLNEFVAYEKNISLSAATKRVQVGRIDIRTPAKAGHSLVKTAAYKAWSRIIHGAVNPNSKTYVPG
ncbi:MAG: excinuclease ABC subunit C, partial [uncultured bacterium]